MRTALVAMIALFGAAGCQSEDVSRELGARCATSRDCDDRCLPPGQDYPDGFCTLTCNTTNECPMSASCAEREGGVCLFDCAVDADCAFLGAAWTCKDTDARGAEGNLKVCRGD